MENQSDLSIQDKINKLDVTRESLSKLSADVTAGDDIDEDSFLDPEEVDAESLGEHAQSSIPSKVVNDIIKALEKEGGDSTKRSMVFKSGSSPLMLHEKITKDVKTTLDTVPTEGEDLYGEAIKIVKGWAKDSKRSLTLSELNALAHALLEADDLEEDQFDAILLGYHIRGENNVIECKNVYNATQELLNSIASAQKDFMSRANLFLDGLKTEMQKKVRAEPVLPQVVNVPNIAPPPRTVLKISEPLKAHNVPTPEEINKKIASLKLGANNKVTTVVDFSKLLGRQIGYVRRTAGAEDPDKLILEYLNLTNHTPEGIIEKRNEVWKSYVAFAEDRKRGKSQPK